MHKTSSSKQFATDRDCRGCPLFQRTPRAHSKRDPDCPAEASGSSYKAHRSIRIDCGGPSRTALTAVADDADRHSGIRCIGILPCTSVVLHWIPQPRSHMHVGSIKSFKALIRWLQKHRFKWQMDPTRPIASKGMLHWKQQIAAVENSSIVFWKIPQPRLAPHSDRLAQTANPG